jgi:hypothetical protein
MKQYTVGALAYYDALFSGLVPCKVIGVIRDTDSGRVRVHAEVTEDVRGLESSYPVYRKGEKISGSHGDIVPRVSVKPPRTGRFHIRILNNYEWVSP